MVLNIAVVGDVHGDWDEAADAKALGLLNPDLVLFVGDFGDEDVNLVKQVSKLRMPKAVILGNHDCCWTALGRIDMLYGKLTASFFDRVINYPLRFFKSFFKPAVERQIELLGDSFVGYKRLDYPHLKLSVVGARPFAMGGNGIYGKNIILSLFGISDLKQSAERIRELILGAPEDHRVIVMGHNGPTGLGSKQTDICGKNFSGRGGDNGDPDMAEAIEFCRGKREIPLVVFGHMHRTEGRTMAMASGGSVYVNGAVVPRKQGSNREFTMVELQENQVTRVAETWINVEGKKISIDNETILYE